MNKDSQSLQSVKRHPAYASLKETDVADAAIYVLSTPPYCQVRIIFFSRLTVFSKITRSVQILTVSVI